MTAIVVALGIACIAVMGMQAQYDIQHPIHHHEQKEHHRG